jgi:hypothetical protein
MKLAGLLVPRFAAKALAARSPVDIALFGVGVTTAAASVVFAVAMFAHGGDAPMVNGMQYLGVFGQPHRHVAVVAAVEPAPARAAAPIPAAAKVADAATAAPTHAPIRVSRSTCRRPARLSAAATTQARSPTPTASSRSNRAWRGCATASRRG